MQSSHCTALGGQWVRSEGMRVFRRCLGKIPQKFSERRLGRRPRSLWGPMKYRRKSSWPRSCDLAVSSITCFEPLSFRSCSTLAVGPNASLLCKVWCDQHAPAAKGCHHGDSSSTLPHMASSTTCDHVAPGVSACLREDGPRTASAPTGDHAIEVPRYRLAASTVDARPDHSPEHEWGREKRPLMTALRL